MSLTYRLSTKGRLTEQGMTLHEVLARLHSGGFDQYAKTGVFIPACFTDRNGNQKTCFKDGSIVIPKIQYGDKVQLAIKQKLEDAKSRLAALDEEVAIAFDRQRMMRKTPPKGWLQAVIDGKEARMGDKSLVALLDRYNGMMAARVTHGTWKHYKTLRNTIEAYGEARKVELDADGLDTATLEDFRLYVTNERGCSGNYATTMMKKLRAFVRWAVKEGLVHDNPFDRYTIGNEVYGTPVYLTLEERDRLLHADLPLRLAKQRDVFVFQCCIGCRVSDLLSLTRDNIIGGAVEYIPRKTKEGRPVVVRVPLNKVARSILARYKGFDRLLPFVVPQLYNRYVKEAMQAAGIDRIVTILNPKTRQEERHPLWEVATSHMARRTFIGNLYKRVKDPDLIGKLSGHKEGSKAFARYRDIDEDMARELVDMLV